MLKSKNQYKYGCFVTVYSVKFVLRRKLAYNDEKRSIKNGGKKQVDETNRPFKHKTISKKRTQFTFKSNLQKT